MSKKDEAKEYSDTIQRLCDGMAQNQMDIANIANMNAALHSTVRSLEELCSNTASSSPCGMSSYGVSKFESAEVTLLYEIRKDVDYVIRVLSAKRLSPIKAKNVLEEVIENITCDHECKSCKYYKPKAIDYCNTARRIADYVVDTGIVEVYEPETK